MGGAGLLKLGLPFKAGRGGVIAPGGKGAALGQVGGVRHEALDGLEHGGAVFDVGQGVEQALGIGMQGVVEHILQGAVLHDLACVHHRHRVAHLRHNAQIVGDHDHGGVVLFLELAHQLQHLGLDGHIQGGGGLVGDEELGVAGQGDGDHHPLLHAPGELMGVFVGPLPGDTHQFQHLLGPLHGGVFIQALMELQALGDLLPHGEHRVQGGHGVLEDHGYVLAPDLVHLGGGEVEDIPAFDHQPVALHHPGGIRHQPEDGQGGGGFACAGLPHQADGLPVAQLQVDAVEGVDDAVLGLIADHQVFHIQDELVFVLAHRVFLLSASAWGPGRPAGRRRSGSGTAPSP